MPIATEVIVDSSLKRDKVTCVGSVLSSLSQNVFSKLTFF